MLYSQLSKNGRILIVDDQTANVALLEDILNIAGYESIVSTTNPSEVKSLFDACRPDLILLDLHMPRTSGYEVMSWVREWLEPSEYLPILVLTADSTNETKRRALEVGAMDLLSKPFDPIEVVLRVRNLLVTRYLHLQAISHVELLATKLCEANDQFKRGRSASLRDKVGQLALPTLPPRVQYAPNELKAKLAD